LGSYVVTHSYRAIDIFWACWFFASISVFLAVELTALSTGHPENTLSDAVWRMEAARTGQPIYEWSFAHFAFTGGFLLLVIWLTGHFGWRVWT
jgi:hypothetical protein